MSPYPQFCRCAYFPSHLQQLYRNRCIPGEGLPLVERCSSFAFFSIRGDSSRPPPDPFAESIGAILYNLSVRGLPTYPSLELERAIAQQAGLPYRLKQEVTGDGSVRLRSCVDMDGELETWKRAVENAMLFLRPLHEAAAYQGDESTALFRIVVPAEADFLHMAIGEIGPLLTGLLHPQCPLDRIVGDDDAKHFVDQRVDFALEGEDLRLIVEIDDETHLSASQQRHDRQRDTALHKAGWEVFRLPMRYDPLVQRIRSSRLWARAEEASQSWSDPWTKAARMLIRGLLNASRIQWAIGWAVYRGILGLDAPEWRIAIREEETAAALPAVQDVLRTMTAVVSLHHSWAHPPMRLFLSESGYGGEEGIDSVEVEALEKVEPDTLDLYIDTDSSAGPAYCYPESPPMERLLTEGGVAYVLRGSPVALGERQFRSASSITYGLPEGYEESLSMLLQSLFHKEKFRAGQVDIITRILRRHDVVALLPTGAGKSLCYQLAGLLQPGLTVVVDPLISLMKDQSDHLRDLGTDGVDYLSSARTSMEKKTIVARIAGGAYRFVFVTPERFQIQEFRDALHECVAETPVAHIVLDEVHCVSEWGHDFRTSYLRIAQVAREYARGSDGVPPIVGLTATASLYVLKDIKRELQLESEESIVYPQELDRKELTFIPIKIQGEKERREMLQRILYRIPGHFGTQPDRFYEPRGQETDSGLVFCIHAGGSYGVFNLLPSVRESLPLDTPVEWFSGTMPKGGFPGGEHAFNQEKIRIQERFRNNATVALVSTKAFGMGIDKPNIRWIIHYHAPGSLEAYYQEAGRAGRDGQDSICFVLYSDGIYYEHLLPYFRFEAAGVDRRFDRIHRAYAALPRAYQDGAELCHNLYFLFNSFLGIEPELSHARVLYQRLRPGFEKQDAKVCVPFYVLARKTSNTSELDAAKNHLERAIYRLGLLGIVKDYTADWNTKEFHILVEPPRDEQIYERLREYVCRYDANYYYETMVPSLKKDTGKPLWGRCVKALVQFVYDIIVEQRIRALMGMMEAIRQSFLEGKDEAQRSALFRKRILDYLNWSEFSDGIEQILSTGVWESEQWFNLLGLVNEDNAGQLVGGCQRALESRPEHPGLLFLSAVGIWLAPYRYSMEEGLRDFGSTLVLLHRSNAFRGNAFYTLVNRMLRAIEARCEVVMYDAACRVLLEVVPGQETIDFVLKHLSDVELGAFWKALNLRTQPLVSRLDKIVAHHSA